MSANHQIPIKTHYRDITYPRLEFKVGELHIILPWGHPRDIQYLLEKNKTWIYRQIKAKDDALASPLKKTLNKKRSETEFRKLVHTHITTFSQRKGQYPQKVQFRKMTSRWGSCNSEKKKITLNTYLRYLPEKIIRYVIFHELTHFKTRRHDKEFWDTISTEFPNYKTLRKHLVTYWYLIQHEETTGEL